MLIATHIEPRGQRLGIHTAAVRGHVCPRAWHGLDELAQLPTQLDFLLVPARLIHRVEEQLGPVALLPALHDFLHEPLVQPALGVGAESMEGHRGREAHFLAQAHQPVEICEVEALPLLRFHDADALGHGHAIAPVLPHVGELLPRGLEVSLRRLGEAPVHPHHEIVEGGAINRQHLQPDRRPQLSRIAGEGRLAAVVAGRLALGRLHGQPEGLHLPDGKRQTLFGYLLDELGNSAEGVLAEALGPDADGLHVNLARRYDGSALALEGADNQPAVLQGLQRPDRERDGLVFSGAGEAGGDRPHLARSRPAGGVHGPHV